MTTVPTVSEVTPPRAVRRRLLRRGGFLRFVLRRLIALVFLPYVGTLAGYVLQLLMLGTAYATVSPLPSCRSFELYTNRVATNHIGTMRRQTANAFCASSIRCRGRCRGMFNCDHAPR